MASAKQNFFSIVLVGRPNPQILNHDFLVQNGILPNEEPFVRKLQEGETPYSDFFSTPPVAQIAYGKYSILVQEDRYQAMDSTGGDPVTSPIIPTTNRYFGDVLKYTPFKLGGLNLNCDLHVDDEAEAGRIDHLLGIDRERAATAFASGSPVVSITASFAFENGRLMVVTAKPKDASKPVKLNFNYEFDYPGEMPAFLSRLGDIRMLVEYRTHFCERLGVSL